MKNTIIGLFVAVFTLTSCSSSGREQDLKEDNTAEHNRKIVVEFYNLALVQKETRVAFERYMSKDFVDHKSSMPLGTRDAAIEFLEALINELPNPNWEIIRTISEGDLVFLHARFTPEPNAPAYSIGDIFRLEDGKIVEHWDIIGEPVTDQKNPNSRF